MDSLEHCHSVEFQGDLKYALSARFKSFLHVSDIDSFSDISEPEISYPFFDNPFIDLLDSSLNNCDFPLDIDLPLSNSSSLHNFDLEAYFQADIHIMTPLIPPNIPLKTPKTIQIPSSLVSYTVLLILHGLKSFLSFTGCVSMNLVIFGLILHMFGSVINT